MPHSVFSRFRLTPMLVVLFAVIGLIPLAAFGLYTIRVASDRLVEGALRELQHGILVDVDNLQHPLDMAKGDLPVLSHVAAMQELLQARVRRDPARIEQWRKALERVFVAFARNRRVYNQIRYIDEAGQELIRIDADGVNPPRIVPRDRLQNTRKRPYFPATMTLEPGQVYASPLELNREGDQIEVPHRSVIRYASPLFDDAGQRRGIVIINLNAGPLLDALSQKGTAVRNTAYVVDPEGFYLLHPDPARRWGGPDDLNTGFRLQQDLPAFADRILSQPTLATVVGDQIVTSQSLALGAGRSAPFLIIVELMPTRIVLAPVAAMRRYLLVLLAGVGAVTVAGAVLIGRTTARPMAMLAQAAERIRQGHLDTRVAVGGSHEIATLGETFNAMTEGLVQAHGRIERQLAELTARQRVTDSILRVLDLTERLNIALQEILTLLGSTVKGALYLVERDRLVCKVGEGFSQTFLALGRDVPLDACPWVGASVETHIPWDPTDPITEALQREGVMAWTSLPLIVERKLEGVLLLADSRAVLLEEETMRTLRAMVDQVAVAIHNARLYAESRQRLARLITLREIDQAIAAQLSLEEVIKAVLERVHHHMQTDAIGLSLIDWDKKRTLLAHLCLPDGAQITGEAFALSESLLDALGVRMESVVIYDLLGDPRVMNHREIIRQYGLKSYLGMPLIVQGRAIGILHMCTTTPHRFTADETDFFATLAGQAAISIQNARLFDKAVRRNEALAALTHGMITLAQSGPMLEALSTMLQSVSRATGSDRSVWLAYDGAARRLHVKAAIGFSPELRHRAEQVLTMSLADPWAPARAVVEGRSFHIAQTVGSPFWPACDPEVRSAYIVPLTYGGRLYGALVILSEKEDGFKPETLSLANTFALYMSAALANSELYSELQRAARQLEAKVEERTRELQSANLKLEQAYKEVESASRHKSAFLATMSHELRTPLNAILGFSELLQDPISGPLTDKQVRYASHIHSSGTHLLALINDLLDLSKVEAGKLELHPDTFGLRDALAAALAEIHIQAEAKQLQLDLQVDPVLTTVTADPIRFKQILLNLLSNAVKFTPEGGRITVMASVKREASGVRGEEMSPHASPLTPDVVEIAVSDTGIGMRAEDLPKLFQPFTQLEGSLNKSSQGTGLGLSLTRRLIELHGGHISAASEGPDRGSTFTVRLPISPPCSPRGEREASGVRGEDPSPHALPLTPDVVVEG